MNVPRPPTTTPTTLDCHSFPTIYMQRAIPVDICLDLIDAVAADPDLRISTLPACALTCSAWLERARYHLYHSVSFDEYQPLSKFSDTIAASRELGALVRHLEISFRDITSNTDGGGIPKRGHSTHAPSNTSLACTPSRCVVWTVASPPPRARLFVGFRGPPRSRTLSCAILGTVTSNTSTDFSSSSRISPLSRS